MKSRRSGSGISPKPFGFIPEPVVTFISESCRNHPGTACIFPTRPTRANASTTRLFGQQPNDGNIGLHKVIAARDLVLVADHAQSVELLEESILLEAAGEGTKMADHFSPKVRPAFPSSAIIPERSSPPRVRCAAPNNGAPLTACGPFQNNTHRGGKGSLQTARLGGDQFAAILVPFFSATDTALPISRWAMAFRLENAEFNAALKRCPLAREPM